MKVDIETIYYIAKLAKLNFTQEEAEAFANEFEGILNHFANIDKEDLTGIQINDYDKKKSALRKDQTRIYKDKKKLFQNVKEMQNNAIVIPKVME